MNFLVGTLVWLLLWLPVAGAQSWPVSAAPVRVRVAKVADSPWPAKVGVAQITAGNLDPLKCQSYVVTTNGIVVGSRVLWAAGGEPATVLFDTSGGQESYFIYLSPPPLPATPAWEPMSGVLVETRRKPPGAVDSWAQMQELWQKATTVQGRSVIPQVYLGLNPHGPAREFLAYYAGQLRVEEAGEYALATVSGDASFLFLDGKMVAQWPGQHGPWEGRHGRYSGKVRLTVGQHALEYYHAVSGSEPLAEVAWRRPGKDQFEVVTTRSYGVVAQFAAVGWDHAPWNPTGVYAEWTPLEQASAQGFHVVTMQLRVPGSDSNQVCRWTFDDNSTATGGTVEHVFAQPGLRSFKVETRPGHALATQLLVRPNWWQLEEWPPGVAKRQKEVWNNRTLPELPVTDLAYLVRYANALGDHGLLRRLGSACWKREKDFTSAQADVFYALGWHYADLSVREFAEAERAFRAALAFKDVDGLLRVRVTLRLAEVLAQRLGRAAEAGLLLANLPVERLSPEENRLRQIILADAALVRGDVETARRGYTAASTSADAHEDVRRRARLEGAQSLLARGDLDEAERTLSQAVWQDPLEKLNLETGLALLKLSLARQEYAAARQQCVALLYVATAENDRAQLLYHLAETEFALGRQDAGKAAVQKLVQEHPYTEAAARAKDKWPGK